MSPVLLSAREVCRTFPWGWPVRRQREVLRRVSLEIRAGQAVGVVGDSGAGKTTLGRILVGVEQPTRGTVLYRGRPLAELSPQERRTFRRRVQMLFQDPEGSLNPLKTVGGSLAEVGRLIGLARQERQEVIRDLLATVGLSAEVLPRFPRQLSGGQNQRVALARILMLEPELVVLDEPTSALDISMQARILHLLKELRRSRSLAYLFISHDPDVVRFMCDEVVVLRAGTVGWQGPAAKLVVEDAVGDGQPEAS